MSFHGRKRRQQFLVFRRKGHYLTRRDRVIPRTSHYAGVGSADFNFNFAKTAVEILISTAICQRVTRTDFGIYPLQAAGDVVGVFYEASASVLRDSI